MCGCPSWLIVEEWRITLHLYLAYGLAAVFVDCFGISIHIVSLRGWCYVGLNSSLADFFFWELAVCSCAGNAKLASVPAGGAVAASGAAGGGSGEAKAEEGKGGFYTIAVNASTILTQRMFYSALRPLHLLRGKSTATSNERFCGRRQQKRFAFATAYEQYIL